MDEHVTVEATLSLDGTSANIAVEIVKQLATGRLILAVFFIFAGLMHFVIPGSYMTIMPGVLPFPRALVLLSGALEIAGGVGLLMERTRRAAAFGLIALLVAVWPANVQMLLNAREHAATGWIQLLLWLRLPIQIPLIWWTWRQARPRDDQGRRAIT